MANPNPEPHPENLRPWPKGQSGNPRGYSQGRRLRDALARAIDERGLEDAIVQTLLLMALGEKKGLKGRTPDIRWFQLMVERLDGKAADVPVSGEDTDAIRRIKIPRRKKQRPGPDGPGGHEAS